MRLACILDDLIGFFGPTAFDVFDRRKDRLLERLLMNELVQAGQYVITIDAIVYRVNAFDRAFEQVGLAISFIQYARQHVGQMITYRLLVQIDE